MYFLLGSYLARQNIAVVQSVFLVLRVNKSVDILYYSEANNPGLALYTVELFKVIPAIL